MNDSAEQIKKRLINIKELSLMIGLSVGTLYNMKANKSLPIAYVKVGRRIKFDLEDVESWIEENKVKPEKVETIDTDFTDTINTPFFS